MKRLKFEVVCPGCEHKFSITARKPSWVEPVRTTTTCKLCESKIIYRVDNGRARAQADLRSADNVVIKGAAATPVQLRVSAIKFYPSEFFLEALEEAKNEKENTETGRVSDVQAATEEPGPDSAIVGTSHPVVSANVDAAANYGAGEP